MNAGIAAVVVDAKDEKAASYYRQFGFLASPSNPLQLFLLTETLLKIFSQHVALRLGN